MKKSYILVVLLMMCLSINTFHASLVDYEQNIDNRYKKLCCSCNSQCIIFYFGTAYCCYLILTTGTILGLGAGCVQPVQKANYYNQVFCEHVLSNNGSCSPQLDVHNKPFIACGYTSIQKEKASLRHYGQPILLKNSDGTLSTVRKPYLDHCPPVLHFFVAHDTHCLKNPEHKKKLVHSAHSNDLKKMVEKNYQKMQLTSPSKTRRPLSNHNKKK